MEVRGWMVIPGVAVALLVATVVVQLDAQKTAVVAPTPPAAPPPAPPVIPEAIPPPPPVQQAPPPVIPEVPGNPARLTLLGDMDAVTLRAHDQVFLLGSSPVVLPPGDYDLDARFEDGGRMRQSIRLGPGERAVLHCRQKLRLCRLQTP